MSTTDGEKGASTPRSMQVHSMHVRAVSGPWDIKMPPVRKKMVGGHLVPSLTGRATSFFSQKHRRVTVEIMEPPEGTSLSATGAWDPQNGILHDKDQVFVRFFSKKKKSGGSHDDGKHNESDDEDDQSVSTYGEEEEGGGTGDKIWRQHSSFRSDGFEILKIHGHGKAVSVKLGMGNETVIRDLYFESAEQATKFQDVVTKTKGLEKERAMRMVAKYKANHSTAPRKRDGGVALGDEIVQSPRDMSDIVEEDDEEPISILVEIVSATDLPIADLSSSDAYVIVRMKGKEIHRTSVISKNLNPIWTLKERSLFVLQMTPEEFFSASSGMSFVIKDYDSVGSNEIMGYVNMDLEELLAGEGKRTGYEIISPKAGRDSALIPVDAVTDAASGAVANAGEMTGMLATKAREATGMKSGVGKRTAKLESKKKPKLFLRFRKATKYDLEFMEAFQNRSKKYGMYAEETFVPIRIQGSKFLRRQHKKGPNGELLRRVRPGPDPSRTKDETEWLTTDQIQTEAEKPSTHWIEAGSGSIGKLYFEVIGCDNLPNLDAATLNLRDKTDAFANIVYEDCIVNTEAIGDCLSPRWLPWTQRAFVFNITHPSSDVFLGIFDHDPERSPLQQLSTAVSDVHDSIGRVVVKVQKCKPNTTYLLTYPLYYGELLEHRKSARGSVTIRLRMEFPDVRKAVLAGMLPPFETVVSVARTIDHRVANYTAQGVHDDQAFSLSTLAGYVEELEAYADVEYLVKEVMMTIWLWRNHFPVVLAGKTYKLPIHSMLAFIWGVLVTWNWNLLPSFAVFSIAWFFLACNEQSNKHPSRWYHCPTYRDLARRLLFNTAASESIEPNVNLAETEAYEKKVEDFRIRRALEKQKEEEQEMALQEELGEEMQEAEAAEKIGKYGGLFKGVNVNPLKPVLYPIQIQLRKVIYALRIGKSIVLWNESYYAFWLTTACLLVSFVFLFIPFGFILRWTMRIVVWIALGPWNRIIDKYYFRTNNPNMTDAERDEALRLRLKARYEEVLKSSTNYFIRKEDAMKMKRMKQFMFGKFLVRVPRFCEDLYEDYPLPSSSGIPFDPKATAPVSVKERKFGQALCGDMIPLREIQAAEDKKNETVEKKKKKKRFWQGTQKAHDSETTPLLGTSGDDKKFG